MTTEENNQTENKNIVEAQAYDEYIRIIQSNFNTKEALKKQFHDSAKEWIPKLCKALKSEGLTNKQDIRDRIEKDCVQFWTLETIKKFLPDELKDEQKAKAGLEGAKTTNKNLQQNTILTNDDNSAGIFRQPERDQSPPEIEQNPNPIVYGDQPYIPPKVESPISDIEKEPKMPSLPPKLEDKDNKNKLAAVEKLEEAGFSFDKEVDIWRNDTGKGMADEFLKDENINQRFKLLVQKD